MTSSDAGVREWTDEDGHLPILSSLCICMCLYYDRICPGGALGPAFASCSDLKVTFSAKRALPKVNFSPDSALPKVSFSVTGKCNGLIFIDKALPKV